MKFIESLPEYYTFKINGFNILMLHGDKYYNDADNIEKVFDRIIEDFNFDICLFGHSHRYLYKAYKNKIFINPGSIGSPNDTPTYKYCIIEITDKVNVTLKEFNTKDSFSKLVINYKKSKYYKTNYVWANLILHTIKDGIAYCDLFLELFNEKIKNMNELSANDFNRIWNDAYKDFIEKFFFA